MVNDRGQLYTIEGIAASMIMLFTTFLVLNATTVYTPGDSHISDMQLEQIGTDSLRMMNMQENGSAGTNPLIAGTSPLQDMVDNLPVVNGAIAPAPDAFDPTNAFNVTFTNYVDNKTGSETDNLHYTASVTYYDIANKTTGSLLLSANRNLSGVEHPVRVTEWVIAYRPVPGDVTLTEPRVVLVEVLLWRD
jgi:hypothetical protein